MEYISSKKASEKWNMPLRSVQRLCSLNRIEGATHFGRDWMIPKDAKKPPDLRYTKNKDCAE